MTPDTDRPILAWEASLLGCDLVWKREPFEQRVMLWFDFDGQTYRFTLSRADAERLMAEVAESLKTLDSD